MAELKDIFIAEVGKLRTLQKEYFRARSPFVLNQAKKQEKVIDNLLLTLKKSKS